ncbi:hypothetical protein GF385_02940 [Candidatus Dependentiae bacterium]|nr:hypothetical protein [Candidatus Dependentiae bacterium]
MTNSNKEKCLQCGQEITGRSDKKFCDAYCRNTFNNKIQKQTEQKIRKTNSILRKNRTILKQICLVGKATVRKEILVAMGYDFRFITHLYKAENKNTYRFCYEYGYRFTSMDKVIVIQWQSYMQPFIHDY